MFRFKKSALQEQYAPNAFKMEAANLKKFISGIIPMKVHKLQCSPTELFLFSFEKLVWLKITTSYLFEIYLLNVAAANWNYFKCRSYFCNF